MSSVEEIDMLVGMPDSVDPDENVIATYYIETTTRDVYGLTIGIALEQTTGTWMRVPAETDEVRTKYAGKVVGIHEIPYERDGRRIFVVQVAYPADNIDANVNQLLTFIIGNISYMAWGDNALKLIDLYLPRCWVQGFKGPKFGIEGVRKLLNVPKRPILNSMIKPCTGISPDVHAKLFYEAAVGGVDVIKDDELLANQKYCPAIERVVKCREMVDKAYEESGEKTLYTVNITTGADKLLEHAEKAIENGANALMLNAAAGFEALRMLSEDQSISVPILYHPAVWGIFAASRSAGIAIHVAGKLARLCGCDLQLFPAYYGKFPFRRDDGIRIANAIRAPFYHIKKAFPGAGGGVHAGLVEMAIKDFGLDCQIPAGAGVHAHPMGPRAGARSIRQAIDAVMQGVPLDEYAKEREELRAALEKWGYPKTAEEAAKIFALRE